MPDPCNTLDTSNAAPSSPVIDPRLQLDAPLVVAVDVTASPIDPLVWRDGPDPEASTPHSCPPLDVDRHLHGAVEPLQPAALRRAALLKLIGLGQLSARARHER